MIASGTLSFNGGGSSTGSFAANSGATLAFSGGTYTVAGGNLGGAGTLAPDLTHIGSQKSKDWILDQINNPRGHKADSIMPSFAQLPETEKQELADYLAGLK